MWTMYKGLFTEASAPFAPFFAPARKFNSLMVENASKMAELQISAARSYTDIGLKQVREALQVNGVEDLQRLATSQGETSRTLAAQLLADTQGLVKLGQEFGEDVQKLLTEDVVAAVNPTAAGDAAKASAATSSSRKSA